MGNLVEFGAFYLFYLLGFLQSIEKYGRYSWLALIQTMCFLQDSLDDSLFAGTGYEMWSSTDDEHESREDRERRHSRKISRQRLYQNYSFREKVTQTVYEWAPLGMAAMLVGLGIAFSYVKT